MHPRQSKRQFLAIFVLGGGDLEVGVVRVVVGDRLLRATTKKRSSTFLRKKCTPGVIYRENCKCTYPAHQVHLTSRAPPITLNLKLI